jgi:hypothetical protein
MLREATLSLLMCSHLKTFFIFAVFIPFLERGAHATIAWRYSAIQAEHHHKLIFSDCHVATIGHSEQIHLKWLNTPERNCILPEVLVKTALISIWTKFFVPIGFFTDSLLVINDCSSRGLSKWGKKGS